MRRPPRHTARPPSALIALRDLFNSGAICDFRRVDVNVEVGQVARDERPHPSAHLASRRLRATSQWSDSTSLREHHEACYGRPPYASVVRRKASTNRAGGIVVAG